MMSLLTGTTETGRTVRLTHGYISVSVVKCETELVLISLLSHKVALKTNVSVVESATFVLVKFARKIVTLGWLL